MSEHVAGRQTDRPVYGLANRPVSSTVSGQSADCEPGHTPGHAAARTGGSAVATDGGSAADEAVAMFHRIDRKVNAMREAKLADPDSLGDKVIKAALPALAGLVAGKLFDVLWRKGTGMGPSASRRGRRRGVAADTGATAGSSASHAAGGAAGNTAAAAGTSAPDASTQQGLVMSLLFAAASAAFGAVVSTLSDRGSQAWVKHRQRKRQ